MKLPWISRVKHETKIWELENKLLSYSMQVNAWKDQVNAELKDFVRQHGQFKVERALREAYIAHLESLVNEMQEDRR